ncbi:hypothetical protein TCON_2629 [Astathelohania contejeani]|uniref:Uncharacterized protein n=1 Tax=Astathelohania contejeani TaxID=164912 RepID=A0ABQ7HVG9_9MICR|nr:hypothetical protein TCON_2629 [Thelohania contejeani]
MSKICAIFILHEKYAMKMKPLYLFYLFIKLSKGTLVQNTDIKDTIVNPILFKIECIIAIFESIPNKPDKVIINDDKIESLIETKNLSLALLKKESKKFANTEIVKIQDTLKFYDIIKKITKINENTILYLESILKLKEIKKIKITFNKILEKMNEFTNIYFELIKKYKYFARYLSIVSDKCNLSNELEKLKIEKSCVIKMNICYGNLWAYIRIIKDYSYQLKEKSKRININTYQIYIRIDGLKTDNNIKTELTKFVININNMKNMITKIRNIQNLLLDDKYNENKFIDKFINIKEQFLYYLNIMETYDCVFYLYNLMLNLGFTCFSDEDFSYFVAYYNIYNKMKDIYEQINNRWIPMILEKYETSINNKIAITKIAKLNEFCRNIFKVLEIIPEGFHNKNKKPIICDQSEFCSKFK